MNPKEKQILEAAIPLFARFGPKKTTIDEIAKDAGVAKGTVYLYFKSKEDIFKAVLRREMQQWMARLREAIRRESQASEKLRRFLRVRFGFQEELVSRLNLTREAMFDAQQVSEGEAVIQEYLFSEQQLIHEILSLGVEQQEFVIDDLEKTSLAVALVIRGLSQPCQPVGSILKSEVKVDLFFELVLKGIGKRP